MNRGGVLLAARNRSKCVDLGVLSATHAASPTHQSLAIARSELSAKRFKSKVDRWLQLLLIVVILADIGAIGMIIATEKDALAATIAILLCLLAIVLVVWILLATHYTVDRDLLVVRCGPFWFNVPLASIESVRSSRSLLSSPALSLDRLLIRCGKRRRILVSPDDKAGFLKAIGQDLGEE